MLLDFIKFPLWKNDNVALISLNQTQKLMKRNFELKIKNKEYTFVHNPCLCGNVDKAYDTVITEKDRFGFSSVNVLCQKCGLIRLKERLDDFSTAEFYKNEYRAIYVGDVCASDSFFDAQSKRGRVFLNLVSKYVDINTIESVFEVGCGAGGILYPFFELNKKTTGCDFGEEYLKYGIEKGLPLYQGEIDKIKTPYNSQDLIILSHVMEHFNNPLEIMSELIEFIAPNKYLLVEVPGIFDINKTYFNPLLYFQNAHVHNYYSSYLKSFFTALGLDVVYGDERCTFLLKKPEGWIKKENVFIDAEKLSIWPGKVEKELKKYYILQIFKLNPYYYRTVLIKLLDMFHLKRILKNIMSKK